jgi:hypothetical protein
MHPARWILPIACAGATLFAQSANDLNGLAAAADRFVSSGMAGSHDPQPLELCRMTGDIGTRNSPVLMSRATDVQHWTFVYRLGAAAPAPGGDAAPVDAAGEGIVLPQHRAVLAECSRGVFNKFRYSPKPVLGMKSLEYTWVAASLDNAILNLNTNGYIRGFSSVALVRPDSPRVSDEYVYVFNCPWERTNVAISCQTGALTWTEMY